MTAETWYTADEAVAAGLAHRVAERPEQEALAAVAGFDLSVFARVPDRLRNSVRPAGQEEAQAALTEDVRSLIGEEVAAQLRAAVSPQVTAKALPIHHTATVDEAWDGPAAVAAMPNDDTVLEYCFAWQSDEAAATPHKEGDDDADDQKANYRFPHHKTKGSPANLAACRNGLARLEGSSIPESDKAGVRAHLQAHLDDADKGDGDGDEGGTSNHAEDIPGWLHNDAPPLPAWLNPAEEAMK